MKKVDLIKILNYKISIEEKELKKYRGLFVLFESLHDKNSLIEDRIKSELEEMI